MLRRLSFVLALMLLFCMVVPVLAASTDRMTDENTYIDDAGNVYTYQDDKVYQLIDGKLYEVVNGNQQSIIDVMKQKPGSDKPDAEVMQETQDLLGKTVGIALSVIIYVFFAMTAFTTACDLAYIGIPAIRSMMYEPAKPQGNMYGGMQQPRMTGNNPFGAQAVQEQERPKGCCFISNELKSIVNSGQFGGMPGQLRNPMVAQMPMPNRNIALMYLKRRAFGIVIIVAVFMLLVTSTVFTDFGLNIGSMLYSYAADLLGF